MLRGGDTTAPPPADDSSSRCQRSSPPISSSELSGARCRRCPSQFLATNFGPTEGKEVMAFLTGEHKDSYGADAGYQSFDLLLLMAEFSCRSDAATGGARTPRSWRRPSLTSARSLPTTGCGSEILPRVWPRLRHSGRARQRDRGPDRRSVHPRSHTRSEAELPSERCRDLRSLAPPRPSPPDRMG